MTAIMAKSGGRDSARKTTGLGWVVGENRYGFLVYIPAGSGRGDTVTICEIRSPFSQPDDNQEMVPPAEGDPAVRVRIDRGRWLALAPGFWNEANRRLRSNGLPTARYQKSSAKPIAVHPSLGKELCILCWAVEDALPDDIPNALLNWEALAPEERWWLYTMTVATTGQAQQRGVGWRRALRAALAENRFVRGEGVPPKARREILAHTQTSLEL